jgi:hypothetical protein
MQDVVYVLVYIAFFFIAALFVVGCDKIIGSDEQALAEGVTGTPGGEPEPEPGDERLAA